MKKITYLTQELLNGLKEGPDEVIVAPTSLNYYGTHTKEDLETSCPYPMILEWDLLMTDTLLKEKQKELLSWPLSRFCAIRVADLGAALWIYENIPSINIHLHSKTANHNKEALKQWSLFFGPRLTRIVLSPEIPFDIVRTFTKDLTVDLEIIFEGPLLLFQTPRKLLSPHELATTDLKIESLEGQQKNFYVKEGPFGTVIFHPKRYTLQAFEEEIMQEEKLSLLYDQRKLFDYEGEFSCFFRANKTDRLFTKLKNAALDRSAPNIVGEVVEVYQKEWMAIKLLDNVQAIEIGDRLDFVSPYGKKYYLTLKEMKDSSLQKISKASSSTLFYVKALRGVTAKSLVHCTKTKTEEISKEL